jgi:hypothetical protein
MQYRMNKALKGTNKALKMNEYVTEKQYRKKPNQFWNLNTFGILRYKTDIYPATALSLIL